MITTLARIIKYGMQSFWRNGWLSTATILIMVLALLTFEGLLVFSKITEKAVNSLQDKIDISAYFKTDASEDAMGSIEQAIKKLPEVKSAEYISKDKALEIFRATHQNDPTIGKALEELGENPLTASLNIKAKDPKNYPIIAGYLENEKFNSVIDKVTYSENKGAIERLTKIVDTANIIGIGINITFALLAVIITFNTIRLAIYSSREEIGVMRLVGASNAYIRGPYIVEGILYGAIATILSFIILIPIMHALGGYVSIVLPSIDLVGILYGNFFKLLGYTTLLGVALGAISSSIAISRYLGV